MFKIQTFEEKYNEKVKEIERYKKLIMDRYKEELSWYDRDEEDKPFYEFVAHNIFHFYSYCNIPDLMYADDMIGVLRAIAESKTFEYIEEMDDYYKYAIMCDKLDDLGWIDWGTSIRGAFLTENEKYMIDNCKTIKVNFASVMALIELAEEDIKPRTYDDDEEED